jgi:hypothetical protein
MVGGRIRLGVFLRGWISLTLMTAWPLTTGHRRRVTQFCSCVLTLVVIGRVLREPNILGISILSK